MSKPLTPELRFKGFTDEWYSSTIANILTIGNGRDYKHLSSGNIPVFGTGGQMTTVSDYLFEGESVMIGRKGTIDRPFYYNGKFWTVDTLFFTHSFRSCIPLFVFPLFQTINWYLYNAATGVPSLSKDTINDIQVNLPNKIEEQQKVANYFSNLDSLIAKVESELGGLEKMKAAMLQKMFPRPGATTPEVRFKGFSEPWKIKKLGEIGSTFTGLSGKTKEDFGHGNARFVTYMNVFSNPISSITQIEPIEIDKSQYAVKYGDIFFTTSSETPEEVGMSSVWTYDIPHTYLNSFCFGFRPIVELNLNFIAYFLRCPFFRSNMIILAQGISRFNISKLKAMELPILLPSLDEQKAIGEYFRNLDSLISAKREKLARLRNIKKYCLDKMFVNTPDL